LSITPRQVNARRLRRSLKQAGVIAAAVILFVVGAGLFTNAVVDRRYYSAVSVTLAITGIAISLPSIYKRAQARRRSMIKKVREGRCPRCGYAMSRCKRFRGCSECGFGRKRS